MSTLNICVQNTSWLERSGNIFHLTFSNIWLFSCLFACILILFPVLHYRCPQAVCRIQGMHSASRLWISAKAYKSFLQCTNMVSIYTPSWIIVFLIRYQLIYISFFVLSFFHIPVTDLGYLWYYYVFFLSFTTILKQGCLVQTYQTISLN